MARALPARANVSGRSGTHQCLHGRGSTPKTPTGPVHGVSQGRGGPRRSLPPGKVTAGGNHQADSWKNHRPDTNRERLPVRDAPGMSSAQIFPKPTPALRGAPIST